MFVRTFTIKLFTDLIYTVTPHAVVKDLDASPQAVSLVSQENTHNWR